LPDSDWLATQLYGYGSTPVILGGYYIQSIINYSIVLRILKGVNAKK